MPIARVLTCVFAFLLHPASAHAVADGSAEMLDMIECSGNEPVHEAGFLSLGGIEQWVTIDGSRCDNPIVLIVHGGPGNPLSLYTKGPYADWQDNFTIVHWDQRGAGRTYGRVAGQEEQALTLGRLARDGIELAESLANGLGQEKLLLTGSSWGSVLAVHMAKARPDLFGAYVGVSQLVDHRDNLEASYRTILERARAANDETTVSRLEALGPPPWTNPRAFGILRRAARAYEAETTDGMPEEWWQPGPGYASEERRAEYVAGEDYSYIQFVGLKGDGMLSKVDLPSLGTVFEMPVVLVQGAEDLVAIPEVARRYFDSISAPQKSFLLIPRTGHDPNPAMVEAVRSALAKYARQ